MSDFGEAFFQRDVVGCVRLGFASESQLSAGGKPFATFLTLLGVLLSYRRQLLDMVQRGNYTELTCSREAGGGRVRS